MKKIYSVSIPLHAAVVLKVEANTADEAIDIAYSQAGGVSRLHPGVQLGECNHDAEAEAVEVGS